MKQIIQNEWVLTYDDNEKLVSMKISPEEHKKHFEIIDNLHSRMISYGYVISEIWAKRFRDFIDEDIQMWYSYFVSSCPDPKLAEETIKWIMGPLIEIMNENKLADPRKLPFKTNQFSKLISAVSDNKVTSTMGKEILGIMVNYGKPIEEILEMEQFKVASNDDISNIVDEIIKKYPEQVEKAKTEPKLVGWLVGAGMKQSGGKINAKIFKELLEKKLKEI